MKQVKVGIVGLVNLPLAQLNAFQEDIKTLPEEGYRRLKTSILEDSFAFAPHVFQDAEERWWLLDGHQRFTALTRMAGEPDIALPSTFPCVEVSADSLEHARRLVLSAASQHGVFQMKAVSSFMGKIGISPAIAMDRIALPGVDLKNFIEIKGHTRDLDSGADQEPPIEPITRHGDLILLGRHRLICGDSLKGETFEKLMDGEKAEITFTSPPYNADSKINGVPMYNEFSDNMGREEYVKFASDVLANCIANTSHFAFWNVSYNRNCTSEFLKQIIPFLDILEETICWQKRVAVPTPYGLTRRWEPVFVFKCDPSLGHLYVGGAEENTWDISSSGASTEKHRAAFPAALPMKAINLTKAKSVLDPFGGTGTTLVAAEESDAKCYMAELSPAYCDLIVSRWEKLTGKKAERLNAASPKV